MIPPSPDDAATTGVAELAGRLAQLAATVEGLHAAVLTIGAAVAAGEPDLDAGDAAGAPAPPAPLYATVDDWVARYFAPVYTRPVGGELRWCPRWYDHPEAAIRLELLWRSWEAYRLRPLGAVSWHRDVLDHHLPILLSDRGPFAACTADRHEPARPLPVQATPPGWWADARAH